MVAIKRKESSLIGKECRIKSSFLLCCRWLCGMDSKDICIQLFNHLHFQNLDALFSEYLINSIFSNHFHAIQNIVHLISY